LVGWQGVEGGGGGNSDLHFNFNYEWFERLWVYAELEFRNYSYISFFIFFKYLVVPGQDVKNHKQFFRNPGIPVFLVLFPWIPETEHLCYYK
jgi:hypothetical protein